MPLRHKAAPGTVITRAGGLISTPESPGVSTMLTCTTLAVKAASTTPPLAARAAVETVRLGSAGLSASYYAMLGLVVHPAAALGLGLVAGAADYVKGNALAAVIDGPGTMRRLIALPLFAVLFVASMIAVDGVLFKLRDALVSGPANVIGEHDRAAADHRAAVAELATLGTVRAPDAIRADMDAAPVSRSVFKRTAECTDITKDESLAACQPLLALRKEMAQAIRKREIEAVRDKAAARLDSLGPRPTSADPQAEAVAHAAGVSVSTAAWILIGIVGLAIELAACFGMYVLGRPVYRPANENRPADGDVRPAGLSDAELAAIRAKFLAPDDRPEGPKPGRSPPLPPNVVPIVDAKARTLRTIRQELAAGRTFPSQAELCRAVGVARSTLSDWLAQWEAAGELPRRQIVGRCKQIASA